MAQRQTEPKKKTAKKMYVRTSWQLDNDIYLATHISQYLLAQPLDNKTYSSRWNVLKCMVQFYMCKKEWLILEKDNYTNQPCSQPFKIEIE